MRTLKVWGRSMGREVAMSRLNPRRHACFSRGGVFEYDDLTVHGNHNPHNSRAGALLIHRPAWVDQHTGGVPVDTHSTPVPDRDGCGWLIITTQSTAVQWRKHGKHGSGALAARALVTRFCCVWRTQKRVCSVKWWILRPISTEVRNAKTMTIVVRERCLARRRDPTQPIDVEKFVLVNVMTDRLRTD